MYLINAQKGPLAITKVRQALNYAVDKDKIIKELYRGYAIPIGSGIPNTDFGYNAKVKPYPYDPARAKAAPGRGRLPERGGHRDPERQRHPPERSPAQRGGGAHAGQDAGIRAKVGVLGPSQRSQLLRANTFPGLLLADPASTTYDADGVLWRLRGPAASSTRAGPATTRARRSTS